MASVEQLWAGLGAGIQAAFTASGLAPQPVFSVDMPTLNTIQQVALGGAPYIALFDRGGTNNITKETGCLNPATPKIPISPLITATLNNTNNLTAATAVSLTVGGSIQAGDTVFLTLATQPAINDILCQYAVLGTDTINTVATALAAAINAQTYNVGTVTAAAVGAVVTVTLSGASSGATYFPRCGGINVTNWNFEAYRQTRDIQITMWAQTPLQRANYGTVLEQLFVTWQSSFGFYLADTSAVRIIIMDDRIWRDTQLQDLFRRDFVLQCNYPVLLPVTGYPIEAIHFFQTQF